MRRYLLFAFLLVLVLAAALFSYLAAHRPMVIGRAMIGGPLARLVTPHVTNLVGHPVPRFMATDLNGLPVSSSDLRGRVVLLSVWATWCAPCRDELPRLEQEIWRKHPSDVAVVAVARGEDAAKVRTFNQRAGLTFTLVPDPSQTISAAFGGNASIPRTYLVSRNGIVVDQGIGYGDASFQKLVDKVEQEVAKR